eukprot:CAMPEP_0115078422 /NCGR_PEP_ID=MMETSP0227-20121206/17542_1 /TAXON_ID=89957 /ORGANISM="Polarella glacialis, Strain CCMP 1383" /LENGTH=46 /DNA_ID= /DNA_START= /DNA_END= /DNA_ORIENTATION=
MTLPEQSWATKPQQNITMAVTASLERGMRAATHEVTRTRRRAQNEF